MKDWNPELYLKFEKQRTQPSHDLAARLRKYQPQTVVDIGCGPGNSTAVLYGIFPHARIIGIDNSAAMVEKAKSKHTQLEFELCSAQDLSGEYDILFSNACLQWIPSHETLIPKLMGNLEKGGVLAVQMPMNQNEALYRIIRETAQSGKWREIFEGTYFERSDVLPPEEYHRILCGCASDFDIWEEVYYHEMPDHAALLDWVRSTRLRPHLDVLSEDQKAEFEGEILSHAKEVYPLTARGSVILRFRRFFFTATR